MDVHRARTTSAANDPQVPVDSKPLSWVEIRITSQYIAYVLIAADTAASTALDTDKGIFTVQPARELWYSANQDVGDVTDTESITWAVLKAADDDEAGRAEIISAINASDGLASSGRAATPALIGPSGPVIWSATTLPSGVKTFEWESASGYKWQLSLKQSGSDLATVAWSTDDGTNSPNTTATALPAKFGNDGAELEMTKVTNPSFSYVFDAYT